MTGPIDFPVPFPGSYWVIPRKLLAGPYPGAEDPQEADRKLHALAACGIRAVINLMEEDEVNHAGLPFVPYQEPLRTLIAGRGETLSWQRLPVRDMSVPERSAMRAILDVIDDDIERGLPVYVHCWGGKGRTGTVIGCYLARHGIAQRQDALDHLTQLRKNYRLDSPSPETQEQRQLVRSWQPGE